MHQSWRQLLGSYQNLHLAPGCTPTQLEDAELRLGHELPNELKSMLSETDGIYDLDGQWNVAWPLKQLVSDNLNLRQNQELTFPDLLAFGDNGCGEPFCRPIAPSATDRNTVLHWAPIHGETTDLAPSLHAFWAGWLSGQITT
jgi:hypothetical protein